MRSSSDWRPQPQEIGDAQHDKFRIKTGSESTLSGVLEAILQGKKRTGHDNGWHPVLEHLMNKMKILKKIKEKKEI